MQQRLVSMEHAWVLVFDADTEDEAVYSMEVDEDGDSHVVLAFEDRDEAERYAVSLREEAYSGDASVQALDVEALVVTSRESFCERTRPTPRKYQMTAVPKLTTAELRLLQDPSGMRGSTYGEITPSGLRALMASCELATCDSFIDLGSGKGSCVLQAARDFHVRRSCGVELAPSRHRLAVAALAAADADVQARTRFIEGDVGAPSVASELEEDSTVVWLSNLLFDEPLMRRIGLLLEGAPSVRCVAALRPFTGGLDGFVADELPVHCEMSWTERSGTDHPCVVYRRVTHGWWMGRRAR